MSGSDPDTLNGSTAIRSPCLVAFWRQRSTIRPSGAGRSGRTPVRGAGASRRMADISAAGESPWNGRTPAAISYSITPNEEMSPRGSTLRLSICSGAM
jgi:hypothetical protein